MFAPKRARDTNTSTCLQESAAAHRSGSAKRKLNRHQDWNDLSFLSMFFETVKVTPCWFLRPDRRRSVRLGRGAMAGGFALATRCTDAYLSHLLITIHHLASSSADRRRKNTRKAEVRWTRFHESTGEISHPIRTFRGAVAPRWPPSPAWLSHFLLLLTLFVSLWLFA